MRVGDVGHPITHGLADGVLERLLSARHAADLGSQQTHTEDVQLLPAHVLLTHVDHALHAEQCADGGRSDPVLSGSGFGDDAVLAHAPGQ